MKVSNMKKQIKVKMRTNWKKKYETSEANHETTKTLLKTAKDRNESDYKLYHRNYKSFESRNRSILIVSSIGILLLVIALLINHARLEKVQQDKETLFEFYEEQLNETLECQQILERTEWQARNIYQLYKANMLEIINTDPLLSTAECCYPNDCIEAATNPPECKCTYLVKCGGWN